VDAFNDMYTPLRACISSFVRWDFLQSTEAVLVGLTLVTLPAYQWLT